MPVRPDTTTTGAGSPGEAAAAKRAARARLMRLRARGRGGAGWRLQGAGWNGSAWVRLQVKGGMAAGGKP